MENTSVTLSWTVQSTAITENPYAGSTEDLYTGNTVHSYPGSIIHMLYKNWYPAIFIYMFLIILLGIPGNFLLLLAFIKDPGLRTPNNYFIFSQSLADLMSFLTSPIFVVMNYTRVGLRLATTEKMLCLVALDMVFFSLLTSLTSLLILSTERFIAVVFPYRYYTVVTEQSAKVVITAQWLIILAVMLMPLLGWNVWEPGHACMSVMVYPSEFFIFLYLMPSLIMIFIMTVLNLAILHIAMSKSKVIPHATVTSSSMESDPSKQQEKSSPRRTSCFCYREDPTKAEQDFRITKTFLKVVGVFYLSWLPYIILTTLAFLYPHLKRSPEWFLVIHEVSKGLLGLNGVCNPFIYAKGNFQWKKVLGKIMIK